MQPRIFKFFSTFLATLLLSVTLTSAAVSAQTATAQEDKHLTNITVTLSEIQSKGAYKAIQTALNSARYCATKDNVYKITVEPGSYDLRSSLHIYSNTTLSLYNVTLTRNKESISNMIRTGDDTASNKGLTGYSPNSNITVEGGTLNGGSTSNTMIKVTHATNFRMISCDVCNVKNAHMMEVAAVDGFKIQNCTFKDQVMDVDNVGYEAIQLDIPKYGHIFGCRSEALNIRDVRIEGCYFDNCPRAIGTHTQILNNPFDGIVITNNTFTNLKSVAIQAENWKNVEISNNRIESTPRAIAIYSVLGNGNGAYKGSVLAKEGATESYLSEKYETPYKANIVISNNTISKCGTVKDVYANYKPLAILLMGQNITKTAKANSDGSGGYPKGDYYIDGVTIKNNTIDTVGHGIFLQDVRNADISDNTISCSKNDLIKTVFNPITTLSSTITSISNNNINTSPYHGMELASSTISNIKGNNITNAAKDGIILEAQAKVTGSVSDNYITKVSGYGLNIRPKCAAGSVRDNIICNCGKGNIKQEKTATASIGDNYFKVADMTSLSLKYDLISLGTGEKYTLVPYYTPANAVPKFTWSSSDPLTASVNDSGVVTAQQFGEADVTVKSSSGKTAVCHIKVRPEPQSIKLNESMLTIGEGESVELIGTLSEGSVSQNIEYVSNNTHAVSVKKSGVITGVGIGTATVVAKTYNGKHACCNVIVKAAPYDIWFDSGKMKLGVGEITTLRLNLPDGSASHSMVYKSDNESVLSVAQNGEILAKAEGTATVTATAFNGAKAICTVSVMKEPTEIAFTQAEYTASVGDTLPLETVLAEDTASHALSFQSSDPDVCRIDKTTGEITARAAGTVTVTVKTYNRLSATCTVTITE